VCILLLGWLAGRLAGFAAAEVYPASRNLS